MNYLPGSPDAARLCLLNSLAAFHVGHIARLAGKERDRGVPEHFDAVNAVWEPLGFRV